ncbi:hypothetical protein Herbaro_02105 [Herbaspirillum sp. WKF16]|uniref:hypothetical protein n=1 Tax=Herbaspirillum sp. WKF16 TaxID=3028312 RepID=UPI0023A91910|nr:hypothetical protein [Herbaspirillum sp. WKF16]WDZ96598.1 hypothetical protein Herbaro_02105 [Herbaspirillum sp. WKF16]
MNQWKKVGFYKLPVRPEFGLCSHAQLPTALVMDERRVRVYFAARNEHQHSAVHFVDMQIDGDDLRFIEPSPPLPLLKGEGIGTFEEHGVYASSVVSFRGKYYMYYIGWNRGAEAPLFYASIGVAVSNDGLNFEKLPGPILSRGEHDPCFVSSPNVYIEDGVWRMTYISGVAWTKDADSRLQSHYHIKHAQSNDGILWRRDGNVAIDFAPGEKNIARSSVAKFGPDDYRMWFSYVDPSLGKYRIGYAASRDGLAWSRDDELAGITVGDELAKVMIAYPNVFQFQGRWWMLYNGDELGKHGFGVAVLAPA